MTILIDVHCEKNNSNSQKIGLKLPIISSKLLPLSDEKNALEKLDVFIQLLKDRYMLFDVYCTDMLIIGTSLQKPGNAF